jgi:hypothetical protein
LAGFGIPSGREYCGSAARQRLTAGGHGKLDVIDSVNVGVKRGPFCRTISCRLPQVQEAVWEGIAHLVG